MSAFPSSVPKSWRVNTSAECCFITAYGTEVMLVQPKGHRVGSCECVCVKQAVFFSVCVSVGGVSAVHSVWETCECVCIPALANQYTPGGVTCAARALLTSFISFCRRPVVCNCRGPSPQMKLLFHRVSSDRIHLLMFCSAASATSTVTVT